MRIFVAVRHSNDPQHYYGGLWSGNFYPALRELGHEIIESQVDLFPTSRFMQIPSDFTGEELEIRARTTQRILDEVRAAQRLGPVHLFLSYFYNAHFDPAGFDELRRLNIPSVNYYCNSIYQFDLVARIAAKADYAWHTEKYARDSYLKVGAHPVWVQMGADPSVYHPVEGVSRKSKTCFVGQRYADRDRWMAAIVRAGIPVRIYGPGWGADSGMQSRQQVQAASREYLGRKNNSPGSLGSYLELVRKTTSEQGVLQGVSRLIRQVRYCRETARLSDSFVPFAKGAVPFQEIADVFAAHEVCLNFSNVWADGRPGSALIPHVRLRDFEAPMCRTCYLTGHTDEIEEFYDLGKEIDTYRSAEELVEKARYYLKYTSEAERSRSAGYARAIRDHTWKCRFEELFRKTGIDGV